MANITKTQFKKKIEEYKDRLQDLLLDLGEFQSELDEEAECIEPYENKNELTTQQEERKDWLENTSQTIGEVMDGLENELSNLDYIE